MKIRLPRKPPQNFVQIGCPRQKYSMSWKLGNIGWIGLKDCPGCPISLIRKAHLRKESEDVSTLTGTDHPNLVNLVEAFYDKSIYLVYQFHGFTVDLGRVCSRPNAEFSKVDIATICKNTLQGLEYIHDALNIAHGDLSLPNIVLHQDGQVRIGKNLSSRPLKMNPHQASSEYWK
jgi:serine/threonine protein kinase